ncbi:MAG TPA: DUF3299 domain-containing protein [Burkholderiales bacterium]|nr:DUF3299 domain-containing protein [Burkholderiales bacterium]
MKTLVIGLAAALMPITVLGQTSVPWETLAQVQLVAQGNVYLPRFADAVLKLDAKEVRLQGFMLPLGVGDKQTHFLLAANPSECAFCMSGGPESVVEVRAKSGVKYSIDAIAVKGRLELVKNDSGGSVFYRLHDAVPATK